LLLQRPLIMVMPTEKEFILPTISILVMDIVQALEKTEQLYYVKLL